MTLGALSALVTALLAASTVGAAPSSVPNISTIAGTGTSGNTGDGGHATEAQIDEPRSLSALAGGGFVWAEPYSNRVRLVQPDGVTRTLAGTGSAGYSGDNGPATTAQLDFAHGAARLNDSSYVIADTLNSVIRKVATNGTITTIVGNGSPGFGGDGGPAVNAQINNPRGIAAMPDGGFVFPDSNNHRVRRVWPDGTITTIAGTGVQGFSGDGGQATLAKLSIPFSAVPTASGGFLIVDVGNQRVRKVAPDGTITTVAGNGTNGYSGDGGPATSASLSDPHAVVARSDGSFLIADTSNLRVRQIATDGTITTFAGNGTLGSGGDGGPAAAASLSYPKGLDLDASGNVLIADEQGSRIRFVGTPVAPANAALPIVSGKAQASRTLSSTSGTWTGTPPAIAYQWRRCDGSGGSCTNIAGATAKTYTLGAADVGSTIRTNVTATNGAGSTTAISSQTDLVAPQGVPPENTVPPTIAGSAVGGQTLTADPGTWTGTTPIAFSYQWLRCDTAGAGCSDIDGATGQSYVLTPADVGSRIRVRVTATNGTSLYASRVVADSPLSYWRFDEASGDLVDTQGFKDGTYVDNPTRGVPGLISGDSDTAVSLDGSSQHLDVPADAAWTSPSASIEILLKPSSTPDNRTIWSTIGPSFTGWWLNTSFSGRVRMFIGNGSAWQFGPDAADLVPGVRHDIVATFDGTNSRLYVDGALESTGPPVTMNPAVGSNVMRFGGFSTGAGMNWPGVLDDASFYTTVLTPAQVADHYDAFASGSTATSDATAVATGGPTAVRVIALTAFRLSGTVRLRWRTAGEVGLLGFNVYRSTGRGRVRLNPRPIAAAGGLTGRGYAWTDAETRPGAARYWVRALAADGTTWWSAAVGVRPIGVRTR